jgi:hypothetical protein
LAIDCDRNESIGLDTLQLNLAGWGHGQYETWQRAGAMALGCGTHFRMAESVSPPAV